MNKRQWGVLIVGAVLAVIAAGFVYTPYDPSRISIADRLQAPSRQHLLGTDLFGRDILSRILIGGRISLMVGSAAVFLGAVGGISLGLWAGFRGGLWDELSTRTADGLYALPAILLALLLATVWGPGIPVVLWAVALGNVPIFLRLTRNHTLKLKQEPYIDAARAVGASDARLMLCHILPNLQAPLLVQFSLSLAGAILAEASLSYLGVGIQPPYPSWGRMLKDAQSYVYLAPWAVYAPGILIALAVVGFNFLGDPE